MVLTVCYYLSISLFLIIVFLLKFVIDQNFEGTRIVAEEYRHEGMPHRVGIDREVILSAGAFDSPELLTLSGIGDAARLQTLRIPTIVDLPGVGRNLQDHVFAPVVY